MADSFSKKENNKKKAQKQQEKAKRREERKSTNNKGKSLDEMMAYVDANGQITMTPPEDNAPLEINLDDIQLGAAPIEAEEAVKTGIITFLSEKGYGFITEDKSKENIFFHINNCKEPVKKGNKVSFEKERTMKGFAAIDIQIVK
ncbi:cold shock domain-containing protein [Elizabethkingia occulta]|jgi:cold shock CspA family protein|uniref:Cold-shock protein n=2 Tax=Elizabethkingia TaxID=308865 RepID=A0ABX3NEQ9_9FLAO|nr:MULTISPECIES: cold shock domain-containing protein [Elizabethkingia]MDR2230828.1 cold shock domain-containing protein [Flavobacteriaceae bacterium]MCL1664602.1 cold shock domain-containing protein [Elizabethkingia ursingii]MCL1668586.1 cold shock domain-containing protein [Elizabethkingia ursingii]MCL1673708.1 cold shock domain-containing protein [Elizabethkingia ursingii]OPB86470.1 cold-shock protein [Elizabethkingia occulta]